MFEFGLNYKLLSELKHLDYFNASEIKRNDPVVTSISRIDAMLPPVTSISCNDPVVTSISIQIGKKMKNLFDTLRNIVQFLLI